jgi:hypothetical protein
MRLLKYGIFCMLVLAASIMIRRPAHVEKAQTQPQRPASMALPAATAKALKGGGGGQTAPTAFQSPRLPVLQASPAPAVPQSPKAKDTQQPSPLVAKPWDRSYFDENSATEPLGDEEIESPFTMPMEAPPLDPLFGPANEDQELPFGGDDDFFAPHAGSGMTEAWESPLSDGGSFGDDQAPSFGEDDGSGFFSDDSSFETFGNKGFGNEEQE